MIRDHRSGYWRSIGVLKSVKGFKPSIITKSSMMLGLAEEEEEVKETIRRLLEIGVDLLTLGQYLRPGEESMPVQRYVHPDEFERLREFVLFIGFRAVAAGPFIRMIDDIHIFRLIASETIVEQDGTANEAGPGLPPDTLLEMYRFKGWERWARMRP